MRLWHSGGTECGKGLHLSALLLLLCLTLCMHARTVENPRAVRELLDRIGGRGTSGRIVTSLNDELAHDGQERFVITSRNGKPYIVGSSMSAVTAGVGWYLNHYAHVNVCWNQLTVDLRRMPLPVPVAAEEHVCVADYRYYLNYCTFGYSMATWTWKRWEQEIDWMALHGVNMPLQIVGLEAVWRDLLMLDYGYSEDEAEDFVAGPAYIAWWGMNNLEGWGGTHDNAWFRRQASLGRKICDRERALGMQPVLPGFSGMVPSNFESHTGKAVEAVNLWCGFQRPAILDPTNQEFAAVARRYYKRLHAVLGMSKYYSMDPFHEGGTIQSGRYREGYRAVYDAMNDNCGDNTKWVIQQWQWADYQASSLTAVPTGRLIVLDLFSDGRPAFDHYEGYVPQEAVFCAIPNFGGRSGFMGRLDNMAANYFHYKNHYPSIRGIGVAPEAIESVPVVYDLLFELPWMNGQPDMTQWLKEYTWCRYGKSDEKVQQAWELMRHSALAFGDEGTQGPIEDVWAAQPNLQGRPASAWGRTISHVSATYTLARRQMLAEAFRLLLEESDQLGGSNYQYDLIEVGSQVMADYAYTLLQDVRQAYENGNTARYDTLSSSFLQLILDMDAFKGTHRMFRLGNWTETAREAAREVKGAVTATPDWFELENARTLITTWGDKAQSEGGQLRDYSYRSWQGLLRDYYYPRWQYYFSHRLQAPPAGWFYSEWNWAHETGEPWGASGKGVTGARQPRVLYSSQPEGNTVEEARKLCRKYLSERP